MTLKSLPPLVALMLTCSAMATEPRTWTSIDGKKIEASIVSATENEVVVKMSTDGKEYTLPIKRLSVVDGSYITRWLEEQAEKGSGASEPGVTENWDAPWPALISGNVSPEIETVEENEEKRQFVYRSPHYEYICDVKLSQNVVRRFAILFEATNDFMRALPLSMEKAHRKKRHLIYLFETAESYARNGGPPGSAGVYISGKDIIMVPLTSLGVIKGAGGYRVDYDKTNKTLPHEIAHQLTDPPYFETGARGWFTEGLAEYVAVTPYRSGKFALRGSQNDIKFYVTGYGRDKTGGRALGETIKVPDLKSFFLQSYESFLANGNANYGIGLLITYYFFHWDGNEDAANIKAFLKALKAGKTGEDALAVLLAGRSYDEMEKDIAKAWGARGIKLEFQ